MDHPLLSFSSEVDDGRGCLDRELKADAVCSTQFGLKQGFQSPLPSGQHRHIQRRKTIKSLPEVKLFRCPSLCHTEISICPSKVGRGGLVLRYIALIWNTSLHWPMMAHRRSLTLSWLLVIDAVTEISQCSRVDRLWLHVCLVPRRCSAVLCPRWLRVSAQLEHRG